MLLRIGYQQRAEACWNWNDCIFPHKKRQLEWFWKFWLVLFEKMCQFLDIHLEFQGGNWYTNRRPSSENPRGEDGYVIEEAEDPCVAQFSEDPVSWSLYWSGFPRLKHGLPPATCFKPCSSCSDPLCLEPGELVMHEEYRGHMVADVLSGLAPITWILLSKNKPEKRTKAYDVYQPSGWKWSSKV